MALQPTGSSNAGLLEFAGTLDCSSNPNYPAGSEGDAYVVSVAGKVGGASGKSVEAGDLVIATADNAGGTEASVGSSWTVQQGNTQLASQAEAEAGADNTKLMTPLRVAQAIAALGGSTIDLGPTVAWVITAANGGDDGTGECGNPAKPYATMDAAYDDGARAFYLGEGTFSGLSKSGNVVVRILGTGRNSTVVTLIESTNENAVNVTDLGNGSFTLTTVGKAGANGAGSGAAGGNGTAVTLTNVVAATVAANGGTGAADVGDTTGGGAGGNGGAVTLIGSSSASNINMQAGNGGDGSASFAAGSGGNTGALNMSIGSEAGTVNAAAGSPGTDNGGGTGTWGTHGGVLASNARIGSIDLTSDGMTESDISGEYVYVGVISAGTPTNSSIKASHINGSWIP